MTNTKGDSNSFGITFHIQGIGLVRVDGKSQCGQIFEGIAFIMEPSSNNPLLTVPKPIGMSAVADIIKAFPAWRQARRESQLN